MAKEPRAEAEQDDGEGAAAPDSGKKKKLILLGVIALVLLLVAGGGTFFALGMFGGGGETATAEAGAEGDGKAGESAPGKTAAIYEVLEPPFLTNYSVQGRPRYLQMSLALMARDQKAIDAARTHMPVIRNRIVLLLSGEDFATLQTDGGRQQLQQKILTAVQEILQAETGAAGVEQVFFTALVMQ